MPLNAARARQCLRDFDLQALFTQELGWDWHPNPTFPVLVEDRSFTFHPVAQKRGFQVFTCDPLPDGSMPDYPTRRKIERQLTKCAHEHLIIYTDGARTTQVWQWVRRQPGKPTAPRETPFRTNQTGEALIQKLQHLAVSLDEEEALTLPDVTGRVRAAFDVERVTKRFYELFKAEHAAFLKFLDGIPDEELERWYVSVMLNRLMFIYFIQKKGFLDGDRDYLAHKLAHCRATLGKDHYYRDFLCPLFFEGFAKKPGDRSASARELLGRVPYLNGGIFQRHQIEELHGQTIAIPDRAFEKLFAFFDAYHWHLDERPLRADNEINPDVLGYIFEKYINQKQMGAYYTKEDITGYISQNTVIPYLFDAAKPKCRIAFDVVQASRLQEDGRQDACPTVWSLLQADPIGYIYEPVRRGVIADDGSVVPESALPEFVQTGMRDPKARMFDKHYNLGQAVIPDAQGKNQALPTETWREYVERRTRCLDLRRKLAAGEVRDINDLITLNLDIRRFAEDAIRSAEGPDLLNAFWQAIEGVTILDPACGSGAFLFAALNVLKPLYDACLDRMEDFLEEWGDEGRKRHPNYHRLFSQVLDNVRRHPNRDYFVLKTIIVRNLYGVDIMDEAVEICKLRLFLKLVAQVEVGQASCLPVIEPLPDIDFNIRAGNSLVGYATLAEVEKTVAHDLAADKQAVARIKEQAEIADRAFQRFHEMQTEQGMDARAFSEAKAQLRGRLDKLDAELDPYLAGEYEISPHTITDKKKYADKLAAWRTSHKPFHWFVHFYGIMARGGFDVIIGNPPYVEYSKIRREYAVHGYATEQCGNLYALCIERAYGVLRASGRFGFIVQAPLVSTQRMQTARRLLRARSAFLSFATFDDRPSKLFDGMHHCRLSIVLSMKAAASIGPVWTTRYHKWYDLERSHLFSSVEYLRLSSLDSFGDLHIPKFRSRIELDAYGKVLSAQHRLGELFARSSDPYRVYYKITGVGHWFTFTIRAPKFWRDGVEGSSTREQCVGFTSQLTRDTAFCCLWSTLHYWAYQARTNCRDFNPSDIGWLPIPDSVAGGVPELPQIAGQIMECLEGTSSLSEGDYQIGGSVVYERFRPRVAKPIFDVVDTILAQHYGFTDEELDFIVNYDIKYRMGGEGAGEEGDEE